MISDSVFWDQQIKMWSGLRRVISVRQGGLAWFAPRCSGWVAACFSQRPHVDEQLVLVSTCINMYIIHIIGFGVLVSLMSSVIKFLFCPCSKRHIFPEGDESVSWVWQGNRDAESRPDYCNDGFPKLCVHKFV